MKKKTEKEFEKYLLEIIKKYSPILLLERNIFEIQKGCENDTALMECAFNYPYLNVKIRYSDKAFEKWNKGEDVVPYVIHEMCHVITDPIYAKATTRFVSRNEIEDERELLTDFICHIVLKNIKI